MKKTLLFLAVVLMSLSMMAQTTYTRISSASELNAGDKVLLVGYYEGQAYAMSYQKPNNRHAVDVVVNGDAITAVVATDPNSQTEPFEITVGMEGSYMTFFDELKGGYLYASGGGNYLKTETTLDDKGQWTLEIEEDGFKPVSNGAGIEQNIMRFNINNSSATGTPLFGCYKSSSNVTGLVYIFKAGGAPVIYPEPSNYPSTFYSTVDKTSVTLDWTDATGAQLPAKYLVLASTGAITVPTDGTPVANGPLAQNVSYGVEAVTFSGLNGGTTYHFAIFPYTNSGENINYKTDGDYPTASATLEDIYCVLSTNFSGDDLAPFTAYNVLGEDQTWVNSSYGGVPFAKMSGYVGGTYYPNEDWLITPDLFANGKYETLTISFDNAYKFDGPALKVMASNDYDGVSDPNEFTWGDMTDMFTWSAGNYEWAQSGEVTMEDIEASHVYLAFVFYSTDTQSSTWEITNVEVYGTGFDAVTENKVESFKLYPNPASSSVNVVAESAAEVQIMDMAGRTVMTVNVVEGANTINVAELESGVYFVKMNSAVVKFVKR